MLSLTLSIQELITKNFDDFKILCETNWDNNELEEDDISIIVINPNLQNNIKKIIPPNDFSFPEPEVVIFTPSTDKNIFNNNIILIRINGIAGGQKPNQ